MKAKFIVIGSVVGLVAMAIWLLPWPHETVRLKDPRSAEAIAAEGARREGQVLYTSGKPAKAEARLRTVVEKYGPSKDRDTQDQIAQAQMTLGYIAADSGDYDKARQTFVNIEKDYSGTGVSSPDFGKLDDQAAYQAIVCLQADGKKKEAIAEYLKFLKERPSSPLIQGVLNRLKRLEPKRTDEFEAAFQRAYDEQERLRHIDMAKCGPRAALYLFQSLGDRSITEDQIFEACGTTVDGTTMKGLIDGLAKFGMTAKGYSLNWNDFKAAQKPLFWLNMNHYVLVLETTDDSILFYDPLFKTKRTVMVPEDGTAKFSANVLTLDLDAYLRRQQGK